MSKLFLRLGALGRDTINTEIAQVICRKVAEHTLALDERNGERRRTKNGKAERLLLIVATWSECTVKRVKLQFINYGAMLSNL